MEIERQRQQDSNSVGSLLERDAERATMDWEYERASERTRERERVGDNGRERAR